MKGNRIFYNLVAAVVLCYVVFCLLFFFNAFGLAEQPWANRTITAGGFLFTVLGTWYGFIDRHKKDKD
jgi:amino acid transporter